MNISTMLNVCEVLEVDLKTLVTGLDEGLYGAADAIRQEPTPPDGDKG